MTKARPGKIYYVPGLISLGLLYICLIQPLLTHPVLEPRPRSMPVVMPEPDHINELIRNEKRQYTKLRLSGKTAEDSISLNYGRLEISRLIEEKDTLRGIHVEFSDRCKYGTYVQLVNICNADAAASYGGYGNDFWIHPVIRAVKKVKIRTTDNYPTCGTRSAGYKSEQEADEIFRDKLRKENLNIVLARLSASFPFFGLLLVMQGRFLWRLFNHPPLIARGS